MNPRALTPFFLPPHGAVWLALALVVCLAGSFSSTAQAAEDPPEPIPLALPWLDIEGGAPEHAMAATRTLHQALANYPRLAPRPLSPLSATTGLPADICGEAACALERARAMGLRHVAAGRLRPHGWDWALNLVVSDTRTGEPAFSAEMVFKKRPQRLVWTDFQPLVRDLTEALVAALPPPPPPPTQRMLYGSEAVRFVIQSTELSATVQETIYGRGVVVGYERLYDADFTAQVLWHAGDVNRVEPSGGGGRTNGTYAILSGMANYHWALGEDGQWDVHAGYYMGKVEYRMADSTLSGGTVGTWSLSTRGLLLGTGLGARFWRRGFAALALWMDLGSSDSGSRLNKYSEAGYGKLRGGIRAGHLRFGLGF